MTDLKFTSQDCSVCHGDISLTNIGIHHVWDDYKDEEVDGDDVQDTCIEDIKSKNHIIKGPTKANMNEKTSDVNNLHAAVLARSDDHANTSTAAAATITSTDVAAISTDATATTTSSDAAATIANTDDAGIASPTQPGPVSALGLVIDYDNSFSLDEIKEFQYRPNSVSYFST